MSGRLPPEPKRPRHVVSSTSNWMLSKDVSRGREASHQVVHLRTWNTHVTMRTSTPAICACVITAAKVRLHHPFHALIDPPRLMEPERIYVHTLGQRCPTRGNVKQAARRSRLPDTGRTAEQDDSHWMERYFRRRGLLWSEVATRAAMPRAEYPQPGGGATFWATVAAAPAEQNAESGATTGLRRGDSRVPGERRSVLRLRTAFRARPRSLLLFPSTLIHTFPADTSTLVRWEVTPFPAAVT